ncbi:MAG TPA: aminopeptidase, partial [Syntrophomonadaceae bacterium]|nr:aminopeptidase [Syntrophomonadaceae bacterium]
MKDPRINTLAKNLVNYSCELQKGEKILIEAIGLESELVKELIKEVYAVGGIPFVMIKNNAVERAILMNASREQMEMKAGFEGAVMKEMQAYIGIRSGDNIAELSDVPPEKIEIYEKYYWHEVHGKIRVPHTKWVVLRYPNPSMAQQANMSTESFEDFYFNVCNLDYRKMSEAMEPLVELINKTDKVRITGPGTDLEFSIKGLPAVKCDGRCNIPDGEVYTAPVRDSVNGKITYNTPSLHQGFTYENISLEFKEGKIVRAEANDSDRINKVFDIDEGARYVGEFSFGLNPY